MACWRVLRISDKFSGAANTTDDQSVDPDDLLDEDADSGSTSSLSTRNRGYMRRPCGITAAKLMRSEDAGMERKVKASVEAAPQARAGKSELNRTAWLILGVLMRSSACLAVPLSCIAACVLCNYLYLCVKGSSFWS